MLGMACHLAAVYGSQWQSVSLHAHKVCPFSEGCMYWVASNIECVLVFLTAQPHVGPLMTSVGNGSGPHSIPLNANLGVECPFSGVPNPVHRWYQNGRVVQSEPVDYGSGDSNIVVQDSFAIESGVYQCHVSNQHGVDITTTVLCAHSEYILYIIIGKWEWAHQLCMLVTEFFWISFYMCSWIFCHSAHAHDF